MVLHTTVAVCPETPATALVRCVPYLSNGLGEFCSQWFECSISSCISMEQAAGLLVNHKYYT